MSAANQYWFRGNEWRDPGTNEPCFWRTHRTSEMCGGCHKHISRHFGQLEYRCYSREHDGAAPLTAWPETPQPVAMAEGTEPGREKILGQRIVATYSHHHKRENITETRHAFGKVLSILPDGALWVMTDRDGAMRVEAGCFEVVQ